MHRRVVVVIFLLLFVFGLSGLPQSGSTTTPFSGLDVLILIDQSGSMWGARPRLTKNDKWDHRVGQAKNVIYRLAEHVENTDYIHRISVIDFGDTASPAFPSPLRLSFDPHDPGSALRQAKVMTERYVTPKALLNTNTPEAMGLGLKEFQRMDGAEHLEGRRRVMLILTDGRPDLPHSGKSLDILRGEVASQADALKKENVGIWVVGLNDADNYWNEGDGEFWEKVVGTGQARLAETASTSISGLVQDIVNEWLGVSGERVSNEYECPPYLRRIVFNINFGLPRTTVSVTDPTGKDLSLSSGGASSVPGTFARFAMDDPPAGIYKINQDPSRSYTNFVERFPPNLKRLSPAGKTSIETEAHLVYQATDSRNEPLTPLVEWPIKASMIITSPSKSSVEIPATATLDGKFEARWKPPALGVYRIRLKGLVTLRSGKQVDVFGADAHSYEDQLEVDNSQPYWLRMISPDTGGGLRVWPGARSAKFEFALYGPKKERVAQPETIVKDAKNWLSIQLIDRSGVPLSAPLPLTLEPSGAFVAALPVNLDWRHGEGWWRSGEMNIRVNAEPGRMGRSQFLDSIELPAEAVSKHVGGHPLSVGPLPVAYSRIILILALLIPLLLVGFMVAWLAPNGMVWWADSRRRRVVELKIYDANEDPNGDYARKYPLTSRRKFKFDRKITVRIGDQEIVARRFRVIRDVASDVVMAQIEYAWQSEKGTPHRLQLTKGKALRLKGLPSNDILISLSTNS